MAARLLVLGPVRLKIGERQRPLSGMIAHLAAALAASSPHGARTVTLIDSLWEGNPPKSADTRIRQLVGDFRKELGEYSDAVATRTPNGYRLDVDHCSVDALDFERLVSDARIELEHGDPIAAVSLAERALGLWSGDEPAEGGPSLGLIEGWRNKLVFLRSDAARLLVQALYEAGLFKRALDAAQSGLLEVPTDPQLTLYVMRSFDALSDPTQARQVFDRHAKYMRQSLEVEPRVDLVQLNNRLAQSTPRTGLEEVTATTLPAEDEAVPFVGRRAEGELFDRALAKSASPKTVLIRGRAGVGKTRFAFEKLGQLDPLLCNALFAKASSSSRPMGLWIDLLSRLVRGRPQSDWPFTLRPMSSAVVHALLLGDAESVTAHEVSRAIASWIRGRTDSTYIMVDDLHLADPDSLEVLTSLLLDPTLTLLSIVATIRDDVRDPPPELVTLESDLGRTGQLSTIEMLPFGVNECAQLASHFERQISEDELQGLVVASGGNAFYLTELLHARPHADSTRSLHHAIDTKISELSADAVDTLEYCAACGLTLSRLALAPPYMVGLDECERQGILLVTKQSVAFAHGIVQRRVYHGLSPSRAETLHTDASVRLAELDHYVDAAQHALSAHPALPLQTAADLLLQASRAPSGALSTRSLAELIQAALDLAHQDAAMPASTIGELRIELARVLQDADDRARSEARRRATEIIRATKNQQQAARFVHSALARQSGGESDTIDLAETALRWDGDDESKGLLKSRLAIETCDVIDGDRPALLAVEALETARRCDNKELLATSLRARLSTAVVEVPDPGARLEWAVELTQLGIAEQDPDWELVGRVFQTLEFVALRDRAAAEVQLGEVSELAARRQRPRYMFLAHSVNAALATASGDSHLVESHHAGMAKLRHHANPDIGMSMVGQQLFTRWHEGTLSGLTPMLSATWSERTASTAHGCALAWTLAEDEPERAIALLRAACGHDFDAIPRGSLYGGCLAMAALAAAAAGDQSCGRTIADLLQPFRGTDLALGAGVGLFGPAEGLLSLLANQPVEGFDQAIETTTTNGYRAIEDRFAIQSDSSDYPSVRSSRSVTTCNPVSAG